MKMACVGRLKSSEADHILHLHQPKKTRRALPAKWLPDLLLSSLCGDDEDIFQQEDFPDMDRGPTLFHSMFPTDMFPSIFDIRQGRHHRYTRLNSPPHTPLRMSSLDRSADVKEPTSPSNVRIIPIKVEHCPSQKDEKRMSPNKLSSKGRESPIIVDSDLPAPAQRVGSPRGSKASNSTRSSRDRVTPIRHDTDSPVILDECTEVPVHVHKDLSLSDSYIQNSQRTSPSTLTSLDNKECEKENSVPTAVNSDLTNTNTYSNKNNSGNVDECDLILEENEVVREEQDVNPAPSYPIYDVLKVKLAEENRQIDYIRGDGNCFFRALSKQLYGTEKFHKAVRSDIVDIIATNKHSFEQFVDQENVQKHVERMSEDHSWATTCEIYAAATLLQRDIYMLTPDHLNENYSWLLFKPVFTSSRPLYEGTHHPCYITLCNTNGNHYDRIVPDHGGCNCFAPHPALAGVSGSVDLT